MKNYITKPLFTLLLITILLSKFSLANTDEFSAILKMAKLSLPAGNKAKLISKRINKAKANTFYSIICEIEKIRIEIEITEPLKYEIGQSILESKLSMVEKLYGPKLTPYPGAITNATVCDKNLLPVRKSTSLLGNLTPYLILNVTDRYAFGNCDTKELKYRGIYIVGFDYNQLIEIKVFTDKSYFNEAALLKIINNFERQIR